MSFQHRRVPGTGAGRKGGLVALALLVVLLLSGLGVAAPGSAAAPGASLVHPDHELTAGVSVGPLASASPVSPAFWGVDAAAAQRFNASDARAVSATPASYLVYPAGILGEEYNYTSGVLTNLTGARTHANTNTSEFVSACRNAGCHAILQLPAEIDQPTTAASYAQYVVSTLGFQPAYWVIGNDPSGWTHFNVSWSLWATQGGGNTTPVPFAALVRSYVSAVSAVDPGAKFLALGAGLGGQNYDKAWIEALARTDGSLLSGIALHSYIEQGPSHPTDAQLFANLNGSYSLPDQIRADRAAISQACSTCSGLQLFVTEINAAEVDPFVSLLPTFAGTVYLAAEVVQGLSLNVTNLDWFAYDSAYAGAWSNRPMSWQDQYYLFRDIAPLLGDQTLPTTVTGSPTLYAVATYGPAGFALLLVNVNTTASTLVTLSGTGADPTGLDTEYLWTNVTSEPVASAVAVAGSVTLPPESIVLLSGSVATTQASYPVSFTESGLPSGTSWSVVLDGASNRSGNPTVGFEAPNGSYAFTVLPPVGYLAQPATGLVSVTGGPAVTPIDFVAAASPEYPVVFTESGLPEGSLWQVTVGGAALASTSSSLSLWEANGTYPYTIAPGAGYSASPASGSVVVGGGPVAVVATITPSLGLYAVTFTESGLAPGLSWALSVGGTSRGAIAPAPVLFALLNGTYPVALGGVAGYSYAPLLGSVEVQGAPLSVTVPYQPTPPSPGARIQTVVGVVELANQTGVGGVAVSLAFAAPGAPPAWVNLTSDAAGQFAAANLNLSGNLTAVSLGSASYEVAWANLSWLTSSIVGLTVVVRPPSGAVPPGVGPSPAVPLGSPSYALPLGLSILDLAALAGGVAGVALVARTALHLRRRSRYRAYFRKELG